MKVIRFILSITVLSLMMLIAGGCAMSKAERRALGSAHSALYMKGDTDEARVKLKSVRDSYEKNFLMACIELTDGNLDEAKSYAQRLIEDEPDIPDGRVLAGLIDRRESYPDEPWFDSFYSAWKAAGSPADLSYYEKTVSCMCCESEYIDSLLQDLIHVVRGIPDELLLAVYDEGFFSDRSIALALKYSEPDTPLEIRLLALSVLDFNHFLAAREISTEAEKKKYPDELRRELKLKRRQLMEQLSEEFPEVMEFELGLFIDDIADKETLDESDIARLEEIVSRENIGFSLPELYEMYRKKLKELGIDNAREKTITVAFRVYKNNLYSNEPSMMVRTAADGVPEVNRLRLARIYKKIAKEYLKRGTIQDFAWATSYLYHYADLTQNEELLSKVNEMYDFPSELNKSSSITSAALDWPIPLLNNEAYKLWMEDWIQFYMLFSDEPMPEAVAELLGY